MAVDSRNLRSDPRANVFLMAVVCVGTASYPVRVRNLSVSGALLEAGAVPSAGEKARLQRGSLCATGEIAWQSEKHCGFHFDQPINVEEWVKRAGPNAQQRIDAAVAEFRDGPQYAGQLSVQSDPSREEMLETVSAELLRVCERIAAMPNLSIDLAEELLMIDAAAHAIRAAVSGRRSGRR